ncbi:MAG: hypothetical protein AAFV93_11855 [Chloroflexota bacterium]
MNLNQWWDCVHPLAVELEKCIVTAPSDLPEHHITSIREGLPDLLQAIESFDCPDDARILRDCLVRSVTYLQHVYQALENDDESEVEFYYGNALTQIAQLHYHLVKLGFAK